MFWHSERKAACRDGVDLVSRRVRHARERGVSNTLLVDQRVRGRRDRIGLDSAARSCCCYVVGAATRAEVGECCRLALWLHAEYAK